jgi:homocysteine S-methyltransferase
MLSVLLSERYQCSTETFKKAGYTRSEAEKIMIRSVELANEARDRFLTKNNRLNRLDIGIALSLGPFGASQAPSCEFTGFYPPPYGPANDSIETHRRNSFQDPADTEKATDALTLFHLDRLIAFRQSEAWGMIDYVAFETIPLLREIRAIRRAMSRFQSGHTIGEGNGISKLWWISCTFPNGEFPEVGQPGGQKVAMGDIVEALIGKNVGDGLDGSVPAGIGINCTPIDALPGLLADMKQAVLTTGRSPLLVVYPGGDEGPERVKDGDTSWAEKLWSIARLSAGESTWGGVVVGGCCMVGPNKIQELAGNLNEWEQPCATSSGHVP